MPRNQTAKAPEVKNTAPVRSVRKATDAPEHVRQAAPRNLKAAGPARDALEAAENIVVEDKPLNQKKAELLAFNEEVLTVQVHETNDPLAEPLPQVIVDGRSQFFQRGVEMHVKRKYVEVLARAKRTTYSQVEQPGGDYKNVPHSALRYPFSVIHDPAGDKGRAWLKAVLAEG